MNFHKVVALLLAISALMGVVLVVFALLNHEWIVALSGAMITWGCFPTAKYAYQVGKWEEEWKKKQ